MGNNIFQYNLKYAMKQKGWSQMKLAQESRLTQAAICRYINGNRLPNIESLVKICNALGTCPCEILGYEHAE